MRHLFIASLGNPGANYARTLHSAGHILSSALVTHSASPPLAHSAAYGDALVSETPNYIIWQSPTYMNTSGPALARAWRRWCADAVNPRLVVLHDEMEVVTGKFSMKEGRRKSARGHNGLKSLLATPGIGELEFVRVGVGIGPRPTSRAPDVVAEFVLRQMGDKEVEKVEDCARPVWRRLEKMMTKGRD